MYKYMQFFNLNATWCCTYFDRYPCCIYIEKYHCFYFENGVVLTLEIQLNITLVLNVKYSCAAKIIK